MSHNQVALTPIVDSLHKERSRAIAPIKKLLERFNHGQYVIHSVSPSHRSFLSLTITETKRSADEADVATRSDSAKRRSNPRSRQETKRGPKVRVFRPL
jgi:hypothetical protein